MSQKILIDFDKLSNLHSGLGQFSFQLAKELSQISNQDLTYLVPDEYVNRFGANVQYQRMRAFYKLFGIQTQAGDILHLTHQLSDIKASNKKTISILTIHDLNYLYKYTGLKRKAFLKSLQAKVNRADIITAISKFTETEIQNNLNLNDKKIHVIYNGSNPLDINSAVKPTWFNWEEEFYFSIGIFTEKKNFHTLLPVIELLPNEKLIISGDSNTEYGKSIQRLIKLKKLNDRVILSGTISEEEKTWLYLHCKAFLFPSIAEGFGLPVIEAMSCGTPVVVSNACSLPEVAGTNASYWDHYDPHYMVDVIQQTNKSFSTETARLLKSHAAQFSWSKAAKAYYNLYKQ